MTIKRVGIVGSGIMGAGVAEVAAKAGFEVVLRSRAQDSADKMVSALEKSLASRSTAASSRMTTVLATLGRVRVVTQLDELAEVDLVIESIVEDLPLQELFTELDRICADGAILATNTSTPRWWRSRWSTVALGQGLRHPLLRPGAGDERGRGRCVLPRCPATDDTIAAADTFAESCGKRRRSSACNQPGFIVNALLFPFLNDAVSSCDRRRVRDPDDIDTAMKGGSTSRCGPLELLDLVGLDTSLSILEALHAAF